MIDLHITFDWKFWLNVAICVVGFVGGWLLRGPKR